MKLALSVVALCASLTATALAQAQPQDEVVGPEMPVIVARPVMPAPSNALELTVGTGYTQGFGHLQGGVGMPSVVTPGIAVDLGVGYRLSPRAAILVSGQFQELEAERASTARGLTTSIAAQYHLAPMRRVDPWIELGAGYRVLWENPSDAPQLISHGLQAIRARVGIDFRAGETAAFGPVIGADATVFLFQDGGGQVATNIADPTWSTFIFAGFQGRFDIGGSSPSALPSVAQR